MRRRLKLTLKLALSLALAVFISLTIIGLLFEPVKTNRDYLVKIIDEHASKNIAAQMVVDAKKKMPMIPFSDDQWKNAQEALEMCLESEEKKYLASGDPYLNEVADENSAEIFATKFLNDCRMLDK
jgi:hypothetical protein